MPLKQSPSGRAETLPPQPFAAERAALAQEVEDGYMEQIRAFPNDPEAKNRLYQDMNTNAVFHVADILDAHKEEIAGLSDSLSVIAENHPHATVLKEMFEGLSQSPILDPSTGADHPFFRTKEIHTEGMDDWVWSELDLTKLSGYRDALRDLSIAFPDYFDQWNHLDNIVEATMETAGARYLSRQWLERNSDDYTDKATGKIFQMTGFILAAAAAAITGTIAFASKKSFTAPLLYAGIAGLIASPQLRRMLFGAPNAAAVETINAVLMNKPFLRQCKKYNVKGEGWANMANDCFGPEAEVRKFLHDVKDPELNHNDVIDTFVSGYPEIEESLRRMIADNGFEGFVDVLKGGKSDEVSQVILDYIRLGSWEFAKDMDNLQAAAPSVIPLMPAAPASATFATTVAPSAAAPSPPATQNVSSPTPSTAPNNSVTPPSTTSGNNAPQSTPQTQDPTETPEPEPLEVKSVVELAPDDIGQGDLIEIGPKRYFVAGERRVERWINIWEGLLMQLEELKDQPDKRKTMKHFVDKIRIADGQLFNNRETAMYDISSADLARMDDEQYMNLLQEWSNRVEYGKQFLQNSQKTNNHGEKMILIDTDYIFVKNELSSQPLDQLSPYDFAPKSIQSGDVITMPNLYYPAGDKYYLAASANALRIWIDEAERNLLKLKETLPFPTSMEKIDEVILMVHKTHTKLIEPSASPDSSEECRTIWSNKNFGTDLLNITPAQVSLWELSEYAKFVNQYEQHITSMKTLLSNPSPMKNTAQEDIYLFDIFL